MSFQRDRLLLICDQPILGERYRKVIIDGLILPVRVGVCDQERAKPQRVRMSFCIFVVEPGRPILDELGDVVCYDKIIQRLKQTVATGRFALLETLAETCAVDCMADDHVHAVTVRVEKLDIYSDVASVGVEIHRSRS